MKGKLHILIFLNFCVWHCYQNTLFLPLGREEGWLQQFPTVVNGTLYRYVTSEHSAKQQVTMKPQSSRKALPYALVLNVRGKQTVLSLPQQLPLFQGKAAPSSHAALDLNPPTEARIFMGNLICFPHK